MTIIRNGKIYYTGQEIKNMLDKSIEKSADELIAELRIRKEKRELINNNVYV